MPIFEMTDDQLVQVKETTFAAERVEERRDLQRLLRENIEIVAPGCMVLAEEFGEWQDSRRRIDLLCLDRDAKLVVVELKRTERGGHMELQAIRYAAMVSTMTFAQAVRAHGAYLDARGLDQDPEEAILGFLDWESADEEEFGKDVCIVLVSADFSKELTSSVMWLNERELDIRCVKMRLHVLDGRRLIDVKQVLPLPEAEDYQVRVREKEREERVRTSGRDFTKYDLTVDGETQERLPKRGTMLALVHALCAKGVSPEEIADAMPWRSGHTWWSVDGEVGSEDFCRLAESRAPGEKAFNPRYWQIGDDDLIRMQGRTYALSKRWGPRTSEAIVNLMQSFSGKGVECREHASSA